MQSHIETIFNFSIIKKNCQISEQTHWAQWFAFWSPSQLLQFSFIRRKILGLLITVVSILEIIVHIPDAVRRSIARISPNTDPMLGTQIPAVLQDGNLRYVHVSIVIVSKLSGDHTLKKTAREHWQTRIHQIFVYFCFLLLFLLKTILHSVPLNS